MSLATTTDPHTEESAMNSHFCPFAPSLEGLPYDSGVDPWCPAPTDTASPHEKRFSASGPVVRYLGGALYTPVNSKRRLAEEPGPDLGLALRFNGRWTLAVNHEQRQRSWRFQNGGVHEDGVAAEWERVMALAEAHPGVLGIDEVCSAAYGGTWYSFALPGYEFEHLRFSEKRGGGRMAELLAAYYFTALLGLDDDEGVGIMCADARPEKTGVYVDRAPHPDVVVSIEPSNLHGYLRSHYGSGFADEIPAEREILQMLIDHPWAQGPDIRRIAEHGGRWWRITVCPLALFALDDLVARVAGTRMAVRLLSRTMSRVSHARAH